jgi:hypothetical protein
MGFITKLQAINQMLLAAGEAPVADLITNTGIDTGVADTVLEQASLDFQLRGLANNKIIRKITPDSNGKLYFSVGSDSDEEGIISADLMSTHVNSNNEIIVAKVYNDGTGSPNSIYLYNFTDETDVWKTDQTYYIEIIKKLKWDHLDTPSQRAILATASRLYQNLTQGDPSTDQFLGYQEQVFNAKGRAADINDKKRNIFKTGDLNVWGAIARTPYINNPNRYRYWQGDR